MKYNMKLGAIVDSTIIAELVVCGWDNNVTCVQHIIPFDKTIISPMLDAALYCLFYEQESTVYAYIYSNQYY